MSGRGNKSNRGKGNKSNKGRGNGRTRKNEETEQNQTEMEVEIENEDSDMNGTQENEENRNQNEELSEMEQLRESLGAEKLAILDAKINGAGTDELVNLGQELLNEGDSEGFKYIFQIATASAAAASKANEDEVLREERDKRKAIEEKQNEMAIQIEAMKNEMNKKQENNMEGAMEKIAKTLTPLIAAGRIAADKQTLDVLKELNTEELEEKLERRKRTEIDRIFANRMKDKENGMILNEILILKKEIRNKRERRTGDAAKGNIRYNTTDSMMALIAVERLKKKKLRESISAIIEVLDAEYGEMTEEIDENDAIYTLYKGCKYFMELENLIDGISYHLWLDWKAGEEKSRLILRERTKSKMEIPALMKSIKVGRFSVDRISEIKMNLETLKLRLTGKGGGNNRDNEGNMDKKDINHNLLNDGSKYNKLCKYDNKCRKHWDVNWKCKYAHSQPIKSDAERRRLYPIMMAQVIADKAAKANRTGFNNNNNNNNYVHQQRPLPPQNGQRY